MPRPKPRLHAVVKMRARHLSTRSASRTPALPKGTLLVDETQLVDLLDAHLDRLHGVCSVLWTMSTVLTHAAGQAVISRTTGFELQQLAKTGLSLAGEALEILAAERCGS